MGPAQSTAAISDSNNAAPRAESFVPPLSKRCCGWCFGMVGRQGPPLRTGDWVELHGLNSSELNGARGEAMHWVDNSATAHDDGGRWSVLLFNSAEEEAAAAALAAAAVGNHEDYLRWRRRAKATRTVAVVPQKLRRIGRVRRHRLAATTAPLFGPCPVSGSQPLCRVVPSERVEARRAVLLHGLRQRRELNGHRGLVVGSGQKQLAGGSASSGRWTVRLFAPGGGLLAVQERNLSVVLLGGDGGAAEAVTRARPGGRTAGGEGGGGGGEGGGAVAADATAIPIARVADDEVVELGPEVQQATPPLASALFVPAGGRGGGGHDFEGRGGTAATATAAEETLRDAGADVVRTSPQFNGAFVVATPIS